ncbi:hypothetical protein EYR38_005020 [Pleurotus pulmonarius]|nr:hypothetical protein EYR38_005020 [Pleurotus pulmonarius]
MSNPPVLNIQILMSSRIPVSSRYGLRSRKPRVEDAQNPKTISRPASAASRRSYSDVAAARTPAETSGPAPPPNDHPVAGSGQEPAQSSEKFTQSGVQDNTPDDDDESSTWTTVTRRNRRSHSASSVDRRRMLDRDQIDTIDHAYDNLSKEQRERIARRKMAVRPEIRRTPSPGPRIHLSETRAPSERPRIPTPEPEPSRSQKPAAKGKNVDPGNWGDVDFEDDDLDPGAQAAAFRLWKLTKDADPATENLRPGQSRSRADTIRRMPPNVEDERRHLRQRLAELEKENELLKRLPDRVSRTPITNGVRNQIRDITASPKTKPKKKKSSKKKDGKSGFLPSSQIPPNSFLGRALNSIDDQRRRRKGFPDGDSGDGGSESSSSSEEGDPNSSDDSSSSSDSSDDSYNRPRHRHRKSSRSKPKSSLKPTPPEAYDGKADLTQFYRFVSDGTAYLKEGGVKKKFRVRKLATFLKGRAYDYYLQQVSMNPGIWTLREFFEGLMNACFPVDLLEQTRSEIDRLWQRDLSVRDYSAQLKQKYDVIGSVSEQEKVVKLWNGFKPVIRAELYREKLNPNISTWDDVVERAELLEVVENACMGRAGNRPPKNPNSTPSESQGGQQGRYRNGNRNSRSGHEPKNEKGRSNNDSSSRNPKNGASQGSNGQKSGNRNPSERKIPAQLTPKELDELRKAGKCFRCKREGHISKDCPSTNSVKAEGGSRPPGFPSHALGIDFEAVEELNTENEEPLQELDLGAIGLIAEEGFDWFESTQAASDGGGSASTHSSMPELVDPDELIDPEEWPEEEPAPPIARSWNARYIPLGDAAIVAQTAHLDSVGLVLGYPGDDDFPRLRLPREDTFYDLRFSIERISDRECAVIDRWYPGRSPIVIDYKLLFDKEYAMPYLYAKRCCEVYGFPLMAADYCRRALTIEDIPAEAARIHLEDWAPYLGDEEVNFSSSYGRFQTRRCANDDSFYEIEDLYRQFKCVIPAKHLNNPKFNLSQWYNKQLDRAISRLFGSLDLPFDETCIRNLFPEERRIVVEGTGLSFWYMRPLFPLARLSAEEIWRSRKDLYWIDESEGMIHVIELNGQQVERGTYPALQRNASVAKDPSRAVPKPLVVTRLPINYPGRSAGAQESPTSNPTCVTTRGPGLEIPN